jgi:hypothetical protein
MLVKEDPDSYISSLKSKSSGSIWFGVVRCSNTSLALKFIPDCSEVVCQTFGFSPALPKSDTVPRKKISSAGLEYIVLELSEQ